MTIAELRSLANYHRQQADGCATAARYDDNAEARRKSAQLQAWHNAMAEKLTELADALEGAARLISKILV